MENPAEDIKQAYDTFVKAFFRSEIGTLVSYVLQGATLDGTPEEAEQNTERLAQFHCVLYGTTTVSDQVKDMIGKELAMSSQYVDFMTQNPLFQQILREHEAKSLAEGKAEGEIDRLRKSILKILRVNFPDTFDELAKYIGRIQNAEVLEKIEDAALVADEQRVQTLAQTNALAE